VNGRTWVAVQQKSEIAIPAEDRVSRVVDGNIINGAEKGQRQNEGTKKGSEGGPPPKQKEAEQNDQTVYRIGSLRAQKDLPWFAILPIDIAIHEVSPPKSGDELVGLEVHAGEVTAEEMRALVDWGIR